MSLQCYHYTTGYKWRVRRDLRPLNRFCRPVHYLQANSILATGFEPASKGFTALYLPVDLAKFSEQSRKISSLEMVEIPGIEPRSLGLQPSTFPLSYISKVVLYVFITWSVDRTRRLHVLYTFARPVGYKLYRM